MILWKFRKNNFYKKYFLEKNFIKNKIFHEKKDFSEKISLKKNCGASRISEWVVKRPALREIRACGARSPSRERSGGAHLLLAEEMHQLRAVQRHEDVTRCVSSSKSHT